ncbi:MULTISPECIES: GNAT family N-acetyltransferase [Rhodomicrobium]|uniref:GNAT family N-acetyltransferase n=1 Tax=Rhodomicrobium TaxID=1068 RepID=UPI00148354AE|nr:MULTISPECIES: GNAT family N-acetyltransferase [Rhodomicrobium]
MAELIIIAGDQPPGFPCDFTQTGANPIEIGALRQLRKSEAFCRKRAVVLEIGGRIAGMALGYKLSPTGETPKLTGLCQSLRPIATLEGRPEASFYVNTIAVYPEYQHHGLGAVLLAELEAKARRAHCSCLLMEVTAANHGAMRFYERHGFTLWPETRRRSVVILQKDFVPAILHAPYVQTERSQRAS